MAKNTLIDINRAKEIIGSPCIELSSETITKLRELVKVLKYEYSECVISHLSWENPATEKLLDISYFIIGHDIKNEEDKLDGIDRLHFGFTYATILGEILQDLEHMVISDTDQAYKILKDYRKTKWRGFLVDMGDLKVISFLYQEDNGSTIMYNLPLQIRNVPMDITPIFYDQLPNVEIGINLIYDAFIELNKGVTSERLVAYSCKEFMKKAGLCNSVDIFANDGSEKECDSDNFKLYDALNEKSCIIFNTEMDTVEEAKIPLTIEAFTKNPKAESNFMMIFKLPRTDKVYPVVYAEGVSLDKKSKNEDENFDLIIVTIVAVMALKADNNDEVIDAEQMMI